MGFPTATEAGPVLANKAEMTRWMGAVGLDIDTILGTAAFPLVYNDGTYTYKITAAGGAFEIQAFKNSTPTVINYFQYDMASVGDLNQAVRRDWNPSVARDVNLLYGNDVNVGPSAFGNPGRDINLLAQRNLNLEVVTGNTNIQKALLDADPTVALGAATKQYVDATTGASGAAIIKAPATSARNVIQSTADATELTLKAFAGQTEPTLLVKNENGNELFAVGTEPSGIPGEDPYRSKAMLRTAGGLGTDTNVAFYTSSDPTETYFLATFIAYVGGHFPIELESFVDTATPANSYTHLRLVAQSGQTVPIFDINNLSGFTLRVMTDGTVISNAHAAPADGDLNNSDFALWHDDTVGANHLEAKMKDSAGTVVSRDIGDQFTTDYTNQLLLMGA